VLVGEAARLIIARSIIRRGRLTQASHGRSMQPPGFFLFERDFELNLRDLARAQSRSSQQLGGYGRRKPREGTGGQALCLCGFTARQHYLVQDTDPDRRDEYHSRHLWRTDPWGADCTDDEVKRASISRCGRNIDPISYQKFFRALHRLYGMTGTRGSRGRAGAVYRLRTGRSAHEYGKALGKANSVMPPVTNGRRFLRRGGAASQEGQGPF